VHGIGQIHPGPSAPLIELKTFGMGLQLDVTDFAPTPRLDDRQPTLAIADHDAFLRHVDAHIVGVIAQLNAAEHREIVRPEGPD
jgi:hypothetical protein